MFDNEPLWKRILLFPLTLLSWIGSALSQFSHGFERGVRKIWQSSSGILDVADRGDSILSSIFGAITWPFRALGKGVWNLVDKLNLKPLFLAIGKGTKWVWYPFAAVGSFLRTFILSRRTSLLWWGIPVVLIMTPVIGIALYVGFLQRGQIISRYRTAHQEAIANQNYEQAEFYQAKLEQLGAQVDRAERRVADSFLKQGNYEEAAKSFMKLAPLDRPGGDLNAHLWLAQWYINGDKEDGIELARKHLERVKTESRDAVPYVQYLEARIAIKEEDLSRAIDLLTPIQEQLFPAALAKFRIERTLNRSKETEKSARIIANTVARRGADFDDNATGEEFEIAYLACQRIGDVVGANRLLETWLKKHPDDPDGMAYKQLFAIGLIRKSLLENPDLYPSEKLVKDMVAIGNCQDEGVRQAYGQIVAYLLDKSKTNLKMKNAIEELLDEPEADAVVYQLVGTRALVDQDYGRGRRLLLQATEKDPSQFAAWNNLAVLIQQGFPNDLDMALRAANKAVELAPGVYNTRETRGMIFLDFGRWQDAIDDLEIALNGMVDPKKVHVALAKAYHNLGNETLAKIHEQKSK